MILVFLVIGLGITAIFLASAMVWEVTFREDTKAHTLRYQAEVTLHLYSIELYYNRFVSTDGMIWTNTNSAKQAWWLNSSLVVAFQIWRSEHDQM